MPIKIVSKLLDAESAITIKTAIHRDRHATIRAVLISEGKAAGFVVYLESGASDAFYFADSLTDALAMEHHFFGCEGLETNG